MTWPVCAVDGSVDPARRSGAEAHDGAEAPGGTEALDGAVTPNSAETPVFAATARGAAAPGGSDEAKPGRVEGNPPMVEGQPGVIAGLSEGIDSDPKPLDSGPWRQEERADPVGNAPWSQRERRPGLSELVIRSGRDGSFSLWSEAFGEGFHSGRGALREARETFLNPSQLERVQPGATLRVVEVCVGTGSNLALLLEACAARGMALEWWGLELDPRPLRLALASTDFRRPWQPSTLAVLEELRDQGGWRGARASGRLLWGEARQTLAELRRQRCGPVDLIWHDAFSPRHCPELWTLEFLGAATALLAPEGRWISYCSAAAVRETLRQLGLHLVALAIPEEREPSAGHPADGTSWSGGTLASPAPLAASPLWRALTPMEREHLASGAGEPYRDPTGTAPAAAILNSRLAAQAAARATGRRGSSSAWRKRWGVKGRGESGVPPAHGPHGRRGDTE